MSEPPICARCNLPMARLSDHDRQALALAKCYPWVCHNCFAGLDSDGKLEPLDAQMNAERSYYLGVIQTLRSIETVKTLLEVCEELRAIFAAGSEMRYAWSGVAPELLHELWGVMDKIGGTIPPRPEAAKSNPSASEAYIQSILDALTTLCAGANNRPRRRIRFSRLETWRPAWPWPMHSTRCQ